jgi:integrase
MARTFWKILNPITRGLAGLAPWWVLLETTGRRTGKRRRTPFANGPFVGELPADGLLFPSPKGHWARRSNYRRNLFDPAATAAGWPRRADGRWQWTFHSLRHVFATWALAQPGARIEDVSRLLGHSTVRVTQDLYIAPDADLYDRFYQATG